MANDRRHRQAGGRVAEREALDYILTSRGVSLPAVLTNWAALVKQQRGCTPDELRVARPRSLGAAAVPPEYGYDEEPF